MSQEEKYKLALFAVIRNSAVMPQGVKLGKINARNKHNGRCGDGKNYGVV